MEKSDFLKKISSMSREEIEKFIDEKSKKRKLIYPAVYINRNKSKSTQEHRWLGGTMYANSGANHLGDPKVQTGSRW
jgi:hypothetical protein